MNQMDANRNCAGYELRSELARLCLPGARRDTNRNLSWVNSICLLFLIIGVVGAKPATMVIRKPPPIEEIIPAIIEPPPPPPPTTTQEIKPDESDQPKPDAAPVVVVTPEAPNISFSVPTIGNLLVPNAVATAPPLNPMRPVTPIRNLPANLSNTGAGGERPQPKYPTIALEQGMEGNVTVLMTADDSGAITSIEVKNSSGHPMLDRATLDFIKRHWILPTVTGQRSFETTIIYKIDRTHSN
jgi:TonB family protein